jgi:hypothetical protein
MRFDMRNRTYTLKARGKRVGLAFVRERGLELEIWDTGPRPRWSAGVPCWDPGDQRPQETMAVPKASSWLLVLPTYACTTRYTRLPSSRPEEIAAMLEFELPQLVPCSTQPWTWDYSIVGQSQDGSSEVLVILSPLSVVEAALEQVRTLGIEPRLVTVRAALHAARLAGRKGPEGTGSHAYVWWDRNSLDFLLMEGRRLAYLRGVRVGEDNSQGLDLAGAEVGRGLSLLERQGTLPEALPIHVGGPNPEVSLLGERLGRMTGVQVCDPNADEPTDRHPLGYRRNIHATAACINLLPRPLKEKDRRTRRRCQIMMHGLRAGLVILLMLVCLRASLWRTTQVLHKHERRLVEIAPLAQKLQFLQSQLGMIQTQVQGSVSMLDIIGQLYQVLPQDVTIHYLSVDQSGQVVIRAQAKRLSQAFDCIDPIERSEYLANVRQNYAHLREMEGQVLIDFELRADMTKPTIKETRR